MKQNLHSTRNKRKTVSYHNNTKDVTQPAKIRFRWIWILYFKSIRCGFITQSQLIQFWVGSWVYYKKPYNTELCSSLKRVLALNDCIFVLFIFIYVLKYVTMGRTFPLRIIPLHCGGGGDLAAYLIWFVVPITQYAALLQLHGREIKVKCTNSTTAFNLLLPRKRH